MASAGVRRPVARGASASTGRRLAPRPRRDGPIVKALSAPSSGTRLQPGMPKASPVSAMAQRLGCSERTVARWRRRLGIASPITPPHRWTGDELASAEALIADGASLHEIARTLNIPMAQSSPDSVIGLDTATSRCLVRRAASPAPGRCRPVIQIVESGWQVDDGPIRWHSEHPDVYGYRNTYDPRGASTARTAAGSSTAKRRATTIPNRTDGWSSPPTPSRPALPTTSASAGSFSSSETTTDRLHRRP